MAGQNTSKKKLKLDSSYESAVSMFSREHDRWNNWAIFFFGSIASIFVLASRLDQIFPMWLFSALSAFVSLAWVIAGQNIRASTWAWREVLLALEKGKGEEGKEVETFTMQKQLCDNFNRWNDLEKTLNLTEVGTNSTLHSVSRMLILVGVVSFLFFMTASFIGLLKSLGFFKAISEFPNALNTGIPRRDRAWGLKNSVQVLNLFCVIFCNLNFGL